jgi:hypothetical protein
MAEYLLHESRGVIELARELLGGGLGEHVLLSVVMFSWCYGV